MVYLVVSNHTSLSGVWEQIETILRAFKTMGLPISISSRIKPGETNILIEDFNSFFVEEMYSVKIRNPNTRYVLCLTEYLTGNSGEAINLNCFSKKSRISRKLFDWEYSVCGDKYNLFMSGTNNDIKAQIRGSLRPFLENIAVWSGSNYGQEIMLAKRANSLHRAKDLFSFCFATTNAVLSSYAEFFDCDLVYLPVLVDTHRTKRNRSQSRKHASVIFSGRITQYRHKILRMLGQKLLNAYPLEGGASWNEDSLLNDTEFKIERLRSEVEMLGPETSRTLAAELEMTQLASFNILTDLYQYSQNKDNTAAYEIYIPQAANWPYSSPNRTLLSIESGFIPLDHGNFSDHELNKVALSVHDADDLSTLLTQDIEKNFGELDKKIDSYNDAQKTSVQKIKVFFE